MGHLRGVPVSNTRAMGNMRMEYKVDGVEVKSSGSSVAALLAGGLASLQDHKNLCALCCNCKILEHDYYRMCKNHMMDSYNTQIPLVSIFISCVYGQLFLVPQY